MSSKSDKNGSSKSGKDDKSKSDKDNAPKSDKYEAPKSDKYESQKSGKYKDSRDDDNGKDKDDHRDDKKGGDHDKDHDSHGKGHDSHGGGKGKGHDSHGNGHGYGHHKGDRDDDHDDGHGHGKDRDGHGHGHGKGHDHHGNGHGHGHDSHGNGHGHGHHHHHNSPPVANPDSVQATEDTSLVILASRLLANDCDRNGDPLRIISVQGAVNGSVSLDGAGNVVFVPAPDFNGTAVFTYTVSDGRGGTDTARVSVKVAAVNDAPSAADDSVDVVGSTPHEIPAASLLSNDTDVDGDALSIVSVQAAQNGTVALNAAGNVVFVPAPGFSGTASFTYTVSDGNGGLSTATVKVLVESGNANPVATDDSVSGVEDTAVVIPVSQLLANDSDPDGDTPFIQSVQDAVNGTVALDGEGNVVFTPAPDFSGPASFTYTVSDGNGGFATATVAVNVVAVADPPEVSMPGEPAFGGGPIFKINADAEQSESAPVAHMPATARLAGGSVVVVWAGFDATTGTNDILARQYGSNGAPLGGQTQASLDAAPGENNPSGFNPAIAALADGGYVVAWNSLTFDETGIRSDVFARRFDADGTPAGDQIRVDAPDAEPDTDVQPVLVTTPDGGFTVFWQSVDASGTEIHGRSFGADDAALGGEFVASSSVAPDDEASSVAVTPLPGGELQVVWQSYDAAGGVYAVVSQRLGADGAAIGAPTVLHTADAAVAPAIAALPGGGYVVVWQSDDGIVAQRFDASGAAEGVAIEVVAPASAASDPSVTGQAAGGFVITWTTEGTAVPPATGLVTDIMGQRFDADGVPLAAAFRVDSATQSSHESQSSVATLDGDSFFVAFTTQSAPGPYGDVVGRVYGDGVLVATLEDVPIPLDITATVSDTDGSEVMSILVEGVVAGQLSAGQDLGGGRWALTPADLPGLTYTFNGNFNGSVALSVTATTTETSNGSSASTQSVLLMFISVEPVNDAPEAVDASFETTKNGELAGMVAATDIDGDTLAYALGQAAAHGVVTVAADGSFVYTPNPGYFGADTFTFVASDPSGATGTGTVSIDVVGVNEAPVAVSSGIWTNTDTVAAGTLTANDTDTPASGLTYTLASGPANGSLVLGPGGTYVYTPTAGYSGTDAFSFTVTDPDGATSNVASVAIDVAAPGGGTAGGGAHNLTALQVDSQFMDGSGGGRTMVVLDTGEHVVAWVNAGALFAQRMDVDGNPADSPFRLTEGESFGQNVALAPVLSGGFVAVWEDPISGQLVMRVFDPAGTALGGQMVISDDAGPLLGATRPSFVVDEFADAFPVLQLAWESAGTVVMASVALPDGTFSERTVLDAGPDAHAPTAALLMEDGSTTVVWQSDGDIYAYNNYTESTFMVNTAPAGDTTVQGQPQITALPDGGFVITWTSTGQDGDGAGIYAQRYSFDFDNETFDPVGSEFRVSTTTSGEQFHSSVTTLSDGGFLVSWTSTQNGAADADLYAQRYNAGGTPSGGEFRLDSSTNGYQDFAEVIGLPDGTYAAAWTSNETGGFEVFAQRFGGTVDPGTPKTVAGTSGNDVIIGSLLDDILVGGDGDDILIGLDGNDSITGGHGRDVMTGGAGADTFRWGFGEAGEGDVVTDYSYADGDVLEVCDLLVGFIPGTSDENNFLQLREEGGDTIIDVNVDGLGNDFVQLAALTGVTGLDVTDMVLNNRIVVFCE